MRLIRNQEEDLRNYDLDRVKREISTQKIEKEESLQGQLDEVKTLSDEKLRRNLDLACEKGAGAWLSALPL